MNSIQRVFATINSEYRDKIALSLTASLYGAKLINCPLHEYYTEPKKYVEGQIRVYEELEPDIIFSPFSLPLFGKAFGSKIKIFDDQPPNLVKPIVRKVEDIRNLDFEKALNSLEVAYFIESIGGLRSALGQDVVIAGICIDPFALPVMLMGLGEWLDLLLSDPDEANKLILQTSNFFLEVTDKMFDAGATSVVLPSVFINPTIVTIEIAKNLMKNASELFSKVKGPIVLHSAGARLNPFLKIYNNLPNVVAFVTDSKDELSTSRQLMSNGQTIIGNLEGPDLEKDSKEIISRKTIEILEKIGHDANFIFGTSGGDIPLNTPIENIKVIKETIENYYAR